MNLSGEHRINAPRDVVWQALNDPVVLRQAIPGCETVEQESPTAFTARVKAKIGPVSAVFSGRVELKDLDPPSGYVLSAEGKGGAAGFASGDARITLREDGEGTLLGYEAEGKVGGKLAQVGARLVEASATKIANTFFSRLDGLIAPPDTLPPLPDDRPPPAGDRKPEVALERVFIALAVAVVSALGIVAAFVH